MANLIRKSTRKKLRDMTPLDAQAESKRRMFEELEKIEAMGQVSELKARPWVRQVFNQEQQKEAAQRNDELTLLESFLKDKIKYGRVLVSIFLRFAAQEGISRKYVIDTQLSDQGVVIQIRGTKYTGAFTPCGMPVYDHHACKILAVKLGNTVAKLDGYYRATESGIVLPDQEDLTQFKAN